MFAELPDSKQQQHRTEHGRQWQIREKNWMAREEKAPDGVDEGRGRCRWVHREQSKLQELSSRAEKVVDEVGEGKGRRRACWRVQR